MKTIIIGVFTFIIVGAIQFFKNKKRNILTKNTDYLEIGLLLYPNERSAFTVFFNLYQNDKKKFINGNEERLAEYEFDDDNLKPLEVLYIFGDNKEKVFLTDWHGEENQREIETLIENKLNIKPAWTNTEKLRKNSNEDETRDGKFIIDLLKTIEKDLSSLKKQFIFFNLGCDAYAYSVVDVTIFKEITDKAPSDFHGAIKLKK